MDVSNVISLPSLVVGAALSLAVSATTIWIQSAVDMKKVRPLRREQELFDGVKHVREAVHELKERYWQAKGQTVMGPWLDCCSALNEVRLRWNIFKPVLDAETVLAVEPLIELATMIHSGGDLQSQVRALSENAKAEELIFTSRGRLDSLYANLCDVKRDSRPRAR